MKKGIRIKEKHSFEDFNLEIATRKISPPKQKRITETVPYMNGIYDFSSLNDEIALENRILTYEFDISEVYTENMDIIKTKFLNWIYQTNEEKIEDDYIPNYYFVGSLESVDWQEDFGKGTIGVSFSVYPYMISKNEIIKNINISEELIEVIETNSSHIINPTIITDSNINIEINDKTFSLSEGTWQDSDIYFNSGVNNIKISGNANVIIKYRDEMI